MEFSAVVSELSSALALVKGAVPSRTTIPLLNNFLIRTDATSHITVTATDMMAEVSVKERCEVVVAGEITVPADALSRLLKGMPSDKIVTLKLDGARLLLSCGKSKFNLSTLPAEDFPLHPLMGDKSVKFSIDADVLHEMINTVRHSALPDIKDRFHLQGINVRDVGGAFVMIATDGHWLSRVSREMPEGVSNLPSIIIPNRAVGVIASVLAGHKDEGAKVSLDERRICIEVGEVKLFSNLVAGEYPDIEPLIPTLGAVGGFSVKASDLSEAMDRLMVVYSGVDVEAPIAIVRCGSADVEVSAGRASMNQGVEVVETTCTPSQMPSFGVNAALLTSIAKLWPSEATLNIQSANPSAPILVTSEDLPNVKCVVMPMNPTGISITTRNVEENVV